MAPSTKPFRLGSLTWPITARQWQALSDMVEDVYQRLKEGVANTSGLIFTVLASGFSISGGDPTSATLTVAADATVSGTSSGTNTGDQTITLTGDVTGSGTGSFVTAIGTGVIVNADINASAGIVDTKLATIATAGKVSNSATTATDANTASAIIARDASGNFIATTPTLTSAIVPLINGGTGTGSTLTLQPTTGAGAAGASVFVKVGNNGGTEAIRVLNNGNVGIQSTATPPNAFCVGGIGGSNASFEIAVGSGIVMQGINRNTFVYSTINFDGSSIGFRPGGANGWRIDPSSHFIAVTDNTYDIGAVGASRPRHVYAGTTVFAPAFQTTTALVALGGGAAPTLGTIGGTGPATAAQNSWLRLLDSTGAAIWVPVWK